MSGQSRAAAGTPESARLASTGADRWRLTGGLTIEQARAALPAIEEVLERSSSAVQAIDAGGLAEFDSSALAVLFEWERRARARGIHLSWSGLPQGLLALARLYGVESMLASADADR